MDATASLEVPAAVPVADRLADHRAPRRNRGGFDAQGGPSRPGQFPSTTLLRRTRYSVVMGRFFSRESAETGQFGQLGRFSGSLPESAAGRPGTAGGASNSSSSCSATLNLPGDDIEARAPSVPFDGRQVDGPCHKTGIHGHCLIMA